MDGFLKVESRCPDDREKHYGENPCRIEKNRLKDKRDPSTALGMTITNAISFRGVERRGISFSDENGTGAGQTSSLDSARDDMDKPNVIARSPESDACPEQNRRMAISPSVKRYHPLLHYANQVYNHLIVFELKRATSRQRSSP